MMEISSSLQSHALIEKAIRDGERAFRALTTFDLMHIDSVELAAMIMGMGLRSGKLQQDELTRHVDSPLADVLLANENRFGDLLFRLRKPFEDISGEHLVFIDFVTLAVLTHSGRDTTPWRLALEIRDYVGLSSETLIKFYAYGDMVYPIPYYCE